MEENKNESGVPQQETSESSIATVQVNEEQDTSSQEPTEAEVVNKEEGYTQEGLKATDFEKIDSSKLPKELLPIYKGMQASYTKKTQELANLKREEANVLPFIQLSPLEAAYYNDESGVKRSLAERIEETQKKIYHLKQQIIDLTNQDPYNPKMFTLRDEMGSFEKELSSLEKVGKNLAEKAASVRNEIQQSREIAKETINNIIPDFVSKRDKISKFLISLAPSLDMDALDKVTDVANYSPQTREVPVLLAWLANIVYEKFGKTNKVQPPRLESPGTGVESRPRDNKAFFDQAKKGGTIDDWARYLKARREGSGI